MARQEAIATSARAAGFYVAGIYREKASGARADRVELLRMIDDLQSGEAVVAEKINRISRLSLEDAEKLVASIRAKGARLAVPSIIDLGELAKAAGRYTGRTPDTAMHKRISRQPRQGELKRGSPHLEPQVPPNGGGEAPSARSGLFTRLYLPGATTGKYPNASDEPQA